MQLENGQQPSTSLLSRAVGKYAAAAVVILRDVCIELNITFTTAPGEAEQQITKLQRQSKVDCILCNDSDYIMLGCYNVLIDRNGSLWNKPVLLWPGPDCLNYPLQANLNNLRSSGSEMHLSLCKCIVSHEF